MKKRFQCKNCQGFYDEGKKCPYCYGEIQTTLKKVYTGG